MGLILDTSVLIAAERKGQSAAQLLEDVMAAFGNQEAAMERLPWYIGAPQQPRF